MINITFEYICDACGGCAVGDDRHQHLADGGRYPQPRQIRRVGHMHVCERCCRKAMAAITVSTPVSPNSSPPSSPGE